LEVIVPTVFSVENLILLEETDEQLGVEAAIGFVNGRPYLTLSRGGEHEYRLGIEIDPKTGDVILVQNPRAFKAREQRSVLFNTQKRSELRYLTSAELDRIAEYADTTDLKDYLRNGHFSYVSEDSKLCVVLLTSEEAEDVDECCAVVELPVATDPNRKEE
jgi:hypothetical protein